MVATLKKSFYICTVKNIEHSDTRSLPSSSYFCIKNLLMPIIGAWSGVSVTTPRFTRLCSVLPDSSMSPFFINV